jgi:hypothetical protein
MSWHTWPEANRGAMGTEADERIGLMDSNSGERFSIPLPPEVKFRLEVKNVNP